MAALAKDAKPQPPPPPPPTILNRLITIDATISLLIHELSLSIPRSLFKTLEISGDGRFFFPIPISLLPFSYSNNKYYFPFLLSFLLGLLLDLLLVGVIKLLIRRPRPVYNKGMTLVISVDHWSFPSGHSSRVFFVAFFVYLEAAVSVLVVGGVLLWAAATSISRVMLGRHFLGDVIAGAGLGVAEAIFVHRFFQF